MRSQITTVSKPTFHILSKQGLMHQPWPNLWIDSIFLMPMQPWIGKCSSYRQAMICSHSSTDLETGSAIAKLKASQAWRCHIQLKANTTKQNFAKQKLQTIMQSPVTSNHELRPHYCCGTTTLYVTSPCHWGCMVGCMLRYPWTKFQLRRLLQVRPLDHHTHNPIPWW